MIVRWQRLFGIALALAFSGASAAFGAGFSEALRILPGGFVPGQAFFLTNAVTLSPATSVYAVEEAIPAGWLVDSPSHNGHFDPASRKLRWGPFYDQVARSLTVRLSPAVGEIASFAGTASFDANETVVRGPSILARLRSRIDRQLPASFFPGAPLQVTLGVFLTPDVRTCAVEDQIPPGWSVSGISGAGVFDALARKVKWVIDSPESAGFSLTYTVTPSGSHEQLFSGLGAFDEYSAPVGGASRIPASFGKSERVLPAGYIPGLAFIYSNMLASASSIRFQAVEESVPDGWSVADISHAGSFDSARRKMKWGPFSDGAPRALTARLTPPAAAQSEVEFTGLASFDEISSAIAGPGRLPPVASALQRVAAEFYLPDAPFDLSIAASPAPFVRSFAVEETIPAGWGVVSMNHSGVFDAATRKLKWGPFFDATHRTFSAQIRPGPSSAGDAVLSGSGSFDEQVISTGTAVISSRIGIARRQLPGFFTPGEPVPLAIDFRAGGIGFQAIEEQLPPGWTASAISHGGVVDAALRKIKWGPFNDRTDRVLTAMLASPAGAAEVTTFAGVASFDGGLAAIAGDDTMTAVAPPRGRPPVAQPDSFLRLPGASARIAVATVLANDSDPDGQSVILFNLDRRSAQGGIVFLEGSEIVYQPGPGDPNVDTFSYSITDGFGNVVNATVSVSTEDPNDPRLHNTLTLILSGQDRILQSLGIPGRSYRVQFTRTLAPPDWSTLATITASGTGSLEYRHPNAPVPTGFYQTVSP